VDCEICRKRAVRYGIATIPVFGIGRVVKEVYVCDICYNLYLYGEIKVDKHGKINEDNIVYVRRDNITINKATATIAATLVNSNIFMFTTI
jgi:hypothetical protein